jgi:hypothetical protein
MMPVGDPRLGAQMSGYFDGPRLRARLVSHVGNGKSLVRIAGMAGIEVVDAEIEIPTNEIPEDLREIGSVFLLLLNTAVPKEGASIEDIRASYRSIRVSRLQS